MSVTLNNKSIKLYLTETESCSYLDNKQQRMIVVDPLQPIDRALSTYFSQRGFRRSGNMTYRPNCMFCSQCISVRIPVETFSASKSQKRVLRKARHLNYRVEPIENASKYFDMYYRYQSSRHKDGIMCDSSIEKYLNFIESNIAETKLLVICDKNKPVCISVIDLLHDGLSAVYTFFEPEYSKLSLGTFSILSLIQLGKKHCFDYIYLGFWVKDSQKMNYKIKFQPLQGFIDNEWQPLISK